MENLRTDARWFPGRFDEQVWEEEKTQEWLQFFWCKQPEELNFHQLTWKAMGGSNLGGQKIIFEQFE